MTVAVSPDVPPPLRGRLVLALQIYVAIVTVALVVDLFLRQQSPHGILLFYSAEALVALTTAIAVRLSRSEAAFDRVGVWFIGGITACVFAYPALMLGRLWPREYDLFVLSHGFISLIIGAPVFFEWPHRRALAFGATCAVVALPALVRNGSEPPDRWVIAALLGATIVSTMLTRALNEMRARVREREQELALLSAQLMSVQEEERHRLSRDLHDGVGQSLTALLSYFWLLDQQLPADAIALRERAAEARHLASRTLSDIRELSRLLRPPALDDFGLLPSLESYLQEFSKRHRIEARFRNQGVPDRLPAAIETAVYRITQEALTNVVRHASATRVSIDLLATSRSLNLIIQDDGRGLTATATGAGGSGLIGIGERVRALGGTITVRSTSGVRIEARFPLMATA